MESILFSIATGVGLGYGSKWLVDSMRSHSDSPNSVDQLLNYESFVPGMADEGYIQLRDGAMLASWSLKGLDLSNATDEQREKVSYQLNRWLKRFGDGWAFYSTNRRIESKGYPTNNHFSNAVTALIDEQRKNAYEADKSHFESLLYFSAIYMPEGKPRTRKAIQEFDKRINDLEDSIGGILGLQRLGPKEHLSYLYDCINFEQRPMPEVADSVFIDQLLTGGDLVAGFDPQMGNNHFKAISITGFPPYTYKGILKELDHLDCEMRWTSRFVTMSPKTQKDLIKKKRKSHSLGARDLTDRFKGSMVKKEAHSAVDDKFEQAYVEESAFTTLKDATQAMSDISEGKTSFAQFTSTILLWDKDQDKLNDKVRKVRKILINNEFPVTVEHFNNVDAWRGSLPGHAKNLRRILLSTYNIADLMATNSIWAGEIYNPSDKFPENSPPVFIAKTEGREPFRHHRPAKNDVGHGMLIGGTGSGKSVYANLEMAQWDRYPNSQVFVFDNGYSGQILCEASGGTHYDISSDYGEGIGFQPFRYLEEGDDDELQWAVSFIELLFSVQNVKLDSEDKNKITNALKKLQHQDPEDRTMTTLFILLQDKRLKETIKIYTKDGSYSILDSNSDINNDSRHQVFELSKLEQASKDIFVPTLMYLFHKVTKALDADRPTLVYVEESWQAFKNEKFTQFIKDTLLTWRKYNGHLCLVVHKPSQLAEIPEAEIIIEECRQKIFCPNDSAISSSAKQQYKDLFDLNEADIAVIEDMRPQREYYEVTSSGKSRYELDMDSVQLSLITDSRGMNLSSRRKKIAQLKEEYGLSWPAGWLSELGLIQASKRFESLNNSLN